MRQASMWTLVSTAFDDFLRDAHRMSLLLCVAILLLVVVPAWGSPGRMVLVNGKLHKILRNSNYNGLSYSRGQPGSEWSFVSEINIQPTLTTPWPCRTYIPTYGTKSDSHETFAAEGLAVFDNKIFVAFTADSSCSDPSAGMSAYVSAFDLRSTKDYPDGHWILFPGGQGDGSTAAVQYNSLGKGSAHTDTPAKGWGSGAAISVFDNQLYLFTDNGVYTSGDGNGWTYRGAPFSAALTNSTQHEPLDAVTINAPDGPRILIVYGYISGQHYYYDHLDAVDWNGKFGSDARVKITQLPDPSGHFRARVSLTVGTKSGGDAGADDTLAAGARLPAVQLFGQSGEEFTTSNHNPARHAEYVYNTIASGWGDWTWDGTRIKYFDHVNPSLMVYPWSEFKCFPLFPARQALQQVIVLLGGFGWWLGDTPFAYASDFLIPQHPDAVPSCTSPPVGIENDTVDIMKNYWTLVGVVLGSPPFSRQGIPEGDDKIGDLSGVEFIQSATSTTETTTQMENTLSLSVGRKITAGLFDMFHVSKSFDAGYKHTWEKVSGTTSSAAVQISDEFGTKTENFDMLGTRGWALFSAPRVYVQDWMVYAYDYPYTLPAGGTVLSFSPGVNLDLQTVSTKPGDHPDYVLRNFDLRDPIESTADHPEGTKPWFKGMGSFEYSDIYEYPEALDYWMAPINRVTGEVLNWQNDERWETRAGDGGSTWYPCKEETGCTADSLITSASKNGISYTFESESMTGSGHTDEVTVQSGRGMGAELGLDGFSVGVENEISVGYDG